MKTLHDYIMERQMGGNWKTVEKDGMKATVLSFDEPSQYGIDKGRISKLEIRDKNKKVVCNFDRGWDVEPTDKKAKEFYDEIIKEYN